MNRLSFPSFRRFLTEVDNAVLILGLMFIGLLLAIGFPMAVPAAELGARCTNLPHPAGGNRQSLLALQGGQEIKLEVSVVDPLARQGDVITVRNGEPITFRVRFTNEDIGPINLYYTENAVTVNDPDALSPNTYGLILEIVSETTTLPLQDTIRTVPTLPAASLSGTPTLLYNLEDLYILRSRGSCFVDIRFSAERLAQIGLTSGEYRVRAFYRNSDRGIYIPPTPNGSIPTATPMFDHLNVWIGTTQSNLIILEVQP